MTFILNKNVSVSTVRRAMKAEGWVKRRQRIKPYLKQRHMIAREKWAQERIEERELWKKEEKVCSDSSIC